MPRRSLIGSIVGGVVSIVAANLLNVPIGAYIIASTGVLDLPLAQRKAVYLATLHANPLLFGISLAIWGVCSLLGGYLAARIARSDQVRVGAISSWTYIALAANALFQGLAREPIWNIVMWFPGGPLFGALGGYLARPRKGYGDTEKTVP